MITAYVTDYFLSKNQDHALTKNNILDFNFIDKRFFNSIEFIEMIADFENQFSIQFTDTELHHPQFKTVKGLINCIQKLRDETSC